MMYIKVCGMRDPKNIADLCQNPIDFIGFIFYPKSARFVTTLPLVSIPKSIKKVGVFVNESLAKIIETSNVFGLDYIQLHGTESSSFCGLLKRKGYKIIKAFSVDENFDFEQLSNYEPCCDYFLLDTKGASYGGNGIPFDWQLLQQYPSNKPFFLSGGIDLESVAAIQELNIPQLFAVDINSKFEVEPALKDVKKVNQFCDKLLKTI